MSFQKEGGVDRQRGGWGKPSDLSPTRNLHSPNIADPTVLRTSGVAVPPQLPREAMLVLCRPHPMASRPAHSPCILSPTAKPRILVNGSHEADKPLRVTAKAGDEVTLDCEAQGSPPPLVTWTKDSRPMLPITDR